MTPADLSDLMEATWPPARAWRLGPWQLRDGAGGGQRVSTATAEGTWTDADVPAAAAGMRAMGQRPIFMIRAGEDALDTALASQGYAVKDPVIAYAAPVTAFAAPGPMTTFPHWPPLSITSAIWADCGTDHARLAVMQRKQGAKCVVLSRVADRPAGVVFVACHGSRAMLHALEVMPAMRRQGSAQNLLQAAAHWASAQGADTLALVVTVANGAARRLYEGLGMEVAGQYHYRQLAD